MAKLSYQQRKALPSSAFVYPKTREYPIPNKAHALDALSRVAQDGSPAQKKRVRAAVHAKFPDIGKNLSASRKWHAAKYMGHKS